MAKCQSLELQSILRLLPKALENADYETLKQIQDEVIKAKLKIFDPPWLEYFHDKFDIELYKESHSTFYNKFKELKLDENRRIRDPRKINKEEDVIIVFVDLSENEMVIDTEHKYIYDSDYDIHDNRIRLNFIEKHSYYSYYVYTVDCRNLGGCIRELDRESDIRSDGKLYIYK